MNQHTAFPDLLGRRDTDNGPWEVRTGPMTRGMAWTELGNRRMSIPHGDTDNERTVRAHEMMHSKVSPTPDAMMAWFGRGKASPEAFAAAEELRVNMLVKRAGFDVDVLTDGGETYDGEQLAMHNKWREAVLSVAAYGGTGRFKSFLVGVRRQNPEWAKTLRALHDRIVKELAKVPTEKLASTGSDPRSGLSPLGYSYTEAVALLLEAAATPPERTPQDERTEGDEARHAPAPPVTEDEVKKMNVVPDQGWWDDIRWSRPARPRRAPGGIGTKKRPAGTGRAPTRINRLATDPWVRVFDKRVRGKGGVVLIDASASMRFTREDVASIVEAAPGCTVAMYCGDMTSRLEGAPNMWLLADRGTMVDAIPDRRPGNSLDLPAVKWAVSARQRPDSPVVWITDGMCHGPGQRYTSSFGVDCARAVLDGGVIVRRSCDDAVALLRSWGRGPRPARWFPTIWRQSWGEVFGRPLPNR